jgi:tRNA G18 (ribose-2'-O)-methylase SpoU
VPADRTLVAGDVPFTRQNTTVTEHSTQRGFFAMGVDRISKPMNVGNLMRSSHAFGASFFFTVGSRVRSDEQNSDTSKSRGHVPYYAYDTPADLKLPEGCKLVGIELLDNAVDLPSFGHPLQAAYILGPEKGVLSPELVARCDYIIKIPTAFCINVAMAGAIVMYDRIRVLGRHQPRPVGEGGPR